jgi:hypothetical protein
MALNFPTNPADGDTYTDNTTTWQFDGIAWNVIPSGSSSFPNTFGSVTVDDTTLSAGVSGDNLTINSGNGILLNKNVTNNTITISSTSAGSGTGETITPEFYIAADDSTQRLLSNGETIQFLGSTGITTSTDAEGNITITGTTPTTTFNALTDATTASVTIDQIYEPAIVMLRVDNIGTTSYTMSSHYGGTNPSIYALAGTTIAFDLSNISGHGFQIQDPLGDPYNTGLVHVATDGTVSTGSQANGKDNGTLYWRIPESISGGYRYQSLSSVTMVGSITIKRLSVI